MVKVNWNLFLAFLVFSGNIYTSSSAATFPEKFVKVVIAVAPGGSQDQLARSLAAELTSIWKEPVIIESKLGGSGSVATQAVSQSRTDGYTILQMDNINIYTNAFLREKAPPYEFEKIMVPVRSIVALKSVLVANAQLPVNSVADLIAMAKRSQNGINYGSFGAGSIGHLDMETLANVAGITLTHVPYKGGSQLVQALIGGEVSLALLGLTSAIAPAREGKIKALAYLSDQRASTLAEVPTLKEAGIPFSGSPVWIAWWVSQGTPHAVIEKLSSDIETGLKSETFKKALEPFGYEILNEPGPVVQQQLVEGATAFKALVMPLNIKLGD